MISPLTRSKLCQVNKQYYDVIVLPLYDIKPYLHHCLRNYHLFILHYHHLKYVNITLILHPSTYLNDGTIDIDVAKLIWNYKRPRLKRCYDILFNAYKCGNIEYINFIYPNIYKLCPKRHTQWDDARLRGAIAGGHVTLVNSLWTGENIPFEYAYECGQVKVIKLLKSYGFKCDYSAIDQAFYRNQVDVIYYEYKNNPNYINILSAKRLAIRKNHLPFIQTLINDGVVFEQFDLSYAKSYHCNKITLNLIQNNIQK